MNKAGSDLVRELLAAVRFRTDSLAEAKRRYAELIAPDFHLMDHLRNDEGATSKYLALLLDSKGSHAQGDLFLTKFIDCLGASASWVNPRELIGVIIEKQIRDLRRIDIYLVFKQGVVGIENKPWAGDQLRQLSDYADFLQSEAQGEKPLNWLLVYLCNEEPSGHSIDSSKLQMLTESGNFVRLDFYQVAVWLEECARFTQASNVRIFVEELATYIRRAINGEREVTELEEIKDLILDKDSYVESAFQVAASLSHLKDHLLTEFKHGLESEMRAAGLALVWDDELLRRGKTYAGFGALLHPSHKVHLRFEFGGSGLNSLEWGICKNTKDTFLSPYASEGIRHALNAKYCAGNYSDRWPWYPGQGLHDTALSATERNWGINAQPWLRIRDKSEQGFIMRFTSLAVDVRSALLGMHDSIC